MLVLDFPMIRIKQVLRSKEFYFYVIGFPLFFLVLFGFLSRSWVPVAQTLDIGYYSADQPTFDVLLNGSIQLDTYLFHTLESYTIEDNKYAFNLQTYFDLQQMDEDITQNKLHGGIELPANFSLQTSAITRFYAATVLVQKLSEMYPLYPSEAPNITAAINLLEPYFNVSSELVIIFHGDITLETTMRAFSTLWRVIPIFIQNYTLTHAQMIWEQIDMQFDYSFKLEIDQEAVSESSIDYNITLYNPAKGGIIENFQKEFYAKLIPAQIVQSIAMASINAIWILEQEKEKGILKRLKLTKMSAAQYIGSILIAFMIIGLLQGIAFLLISAALGFFSFSVQPLVWLFILASMIGLGVMSATIAILVGSFMNARIATPILVLVSTTLAMFVGEYFLVPPTLFTFAGKNFTIYDIVPMRPAFLVMKNGFLLTAGKGIETIWFDMLLTILWCFVIFTAGVFFFNKYKLQYAEKE